MRKSKKQKTCPKKQSKVSNNKNTINKKTLKKKIKIQNEALIPI
jgi:hypothetical protein